MALEARGGRDRTKMDFNFFFETFIKLIADWWWLILPVILYGIFFELWVEYAVNRFLEATPRHLIEIKIPKEVLKSPRAMESILGQMHGMHRNLLRTERFIDGEIPLTISLEIAGFDGQVHFYIRVPQVRKRWLMSQIYAQYPSAEIIDPAEDYTYKVPLDAGLTQESGWEMIGTEFQLNKETYYPIKTYIDWELEKAAKTEEKVDPIANIVELFSLTNINEHFWFQMVLEPHFGWEKEGFKEIEKLSGRKIEEIPSFMESLRAGLKESLQVLNPLTQSKTQKEEKFEFRWPNEAEMQLMKAIYKKCSKVGWATTLRILYLAQKDRFVKRHGYAFLGLLRPLTGENGIRLDTSTITKIDYFFKDLRVFERKRAILKKYRWRSADFSKNKKFILNIEELATIYHFPGREAPSPTVQRVEFEKGAPPGTLPTI